MSDRTPETGPLPPEIDLAVPSIGVRTVRGESRASARAESLMAEHRVPVVLELILERVTDIAMGTEIDDINEFEEILCLDPTLSLETGWVSLREEPGDSPGED